MHNGLKQAVVAACVAALAIGVAAAAGGTVKEKATGVEFPAVRSVEGVAAPLALTGTGVRTKIVFKVYAFGLYVDPKAAKEGLAKWAGKSADDLRKDPALYAAIDELKGDRLAVMHFVRDVDSGKMREAMTEAMDRGVPANDPARKAFLDLWTGEIKNGEDVLLLFTADGKTSLIRGGKTVGTVASPALARSVLQSWLGPKPVSDDIQQGIVTALPELLK